MNTVIKKIVKKLIERWFENSDAVILHILGVIQESLMEIQPIDEAYDFLDIRK